MKAATLLIVLLSNQGYWFGGREGIITLRPAVKGGLPAAAISWKLMLDGVQIQSGKTQLTGDDADTIVRLTPPAPRVRTMLIWNYDVVDRAGKSLEHANRTLVVFPDNLLDHLTDRIKEMTLAVWDDPSGLPKLLDQAHVKYVLVDSGSLEVSKADVVLVGEGQIDDSAFTQAPLMALAQSGASVMIFRQSKPRELMAYEVVERTTPSQLEWRTDHPLLVNFQAEDLNSWIVEAPRLLAIQLPADEAALEIGYFKREVAGRDPAPIDAALMTKSVGKGRFVLCQLPLGDWSRDPRSQILLSNAIDYLLTPPQPTPRPSQRTVLRPIASQPTRTLDIPGVEP